MVLCSGCMPINGEFSNGVKHEHDFFQGGGKKNVLWTLQ